MGGRGGSPNPGRKDAGPPATAPVAAPVTAPAAPRSVDDQIFAAYAKLAERPNELVSLARLRDAIAEKDRSVVDEALRRLDRARRIALDPDPNTKAIPKEGHDAAIKVGGEAKHFITPIR